MKERKLEFYTIKSDYSQEQIKESLSVIKNKAINGFESSLKCLETIASKNDMILPISYLSTYGLTKGISDRGLGKELLSDIQQSHIELLQAISLKFCNLENGFNYHEIMTDTIDSVKEIHMNFPFTRINQTIDKKDIDFTFLIEQIRSHTQNIRNWGYYSFELKIINELSARLDTDLKKILGYSLFDSNRLFNYLFKRSEKYINSNFMLMKQINRNKEAKDLIHEYNKIYSDNLKLDDIPKESDGSISIKQARMYIFFQNTFLLDNFFSFTINEIENETSIELESIKNILLDYSLQFGELKDYETKHLVLLNPVWFKPIIQLDEERLFCSLSSLYFNNFFRKITSSPLLSDHRTKAFISKKKSDYLEEKIEQLVDEYFPEGKIYSNVKWKSGNVQYETDILLVYYGLILIIEAKSGSLSEKALRGEPARTKRHINELFIAPINQAFKFQKYIENHNKNGKISTISHGDIDVSDTFKILKLSISLEDFAAIQSNMNKMRTIQGIDDFENIVAMNLADFEVVLKLILKPENIIHYLSWRNDLLAYNFHANEIDLLGAYLENKFNNYYIENSGHFIVFDDLSIRIDNYFESLENRIEAKRPEISNTKYWNLLLNEISNKKFQGWLDIWLQLQSLLYDDQKDISRKIKKYPKYLKKNKNSKNRKDSIFYQNYKNDIIIFLFVFCSDYSKRHDIAKHFAQIAFDEFDTEVCYVVGFKIDDNRNPYSFIKKIGNKTQ